jgi:hypothetical protein
MATRKASAKEFGGWQNKGGREFGGASGSGQDPLELLLIELMRAAGLVRRITTNLNQAIAKLTATGQPAGELPRWAAESRHYADHIDAVADVVRKALR